MAGKQRRKNNLAKHKEYGKIRKTKYYKRDLDQIIDDLEPQNFVKLTNQEINEEKPGLGQFYCVWCSKYFINNHSLVHHQKSKEHKKRLKALKDPPYTIKDSLIYAGLKVEETNK